MEIDKNIPIPQAMNKAKYPWRKMEVGDSFLFSKKSDLKNLKHASSLAGAASRRMGIKFSCRKTNEGIRVWRI